MACGKTTLGTALAGSAGVEFFDLDKAVEAEAGCPISEIFSRHGEKEFRLMESDTLKRLVNTARAAAGTVIIGCGGGTPCHGSNMDLMLKEGTVVWLRASRERTIARLLEAAADGRRPLMSGLDAQGIAARHDADMTARSPHYSRAHAVFDSSHLDTADEINESVKAFTVKFLKYPENRTHD